MVLCIAGDSQLEAVAWISARQDLYAHLLNVADLCDVDVAAIKGRCGVLFRRKRDSSGTRRILVLVATDVAVLMLMLMPIQYSDYQRRSSEEQEEIGTAATS